jgi:hypothetical protein
MWNLDTIMKAIQIVGAATPAAKAIYDGFQAVLGDKDQASLKERYAEARKASDDLHDNVQAKLG